MDMSSKQEYSTIGIDPETRQLVQSLKRGGETYDELLRKMADAYEPEEE